jgi:hypothetical protein
MVLRKRLQPYATNLHGFDAESGQQQIVYHRKIGAFCVVIALFSIWGVVAKLSGGVNDEHTTCCDVVTRDIYRFIGSSNHAYVKEQNQRCMCDNRIDTRVMGMMVNKMAQSHQDMSSQCVTALEFGIPVCAASYQQHDHSNSMSFEIMSPVIEAVSNETYAITEEYNVHDSTRERTVVQRKQRPYSAVVSYDTMDGRVESKHVVGALCHCIVFLHDLCANYTLELR